VSPLITSGAATAMVPSAGSPLIQIRDLIYRTAGIFQADNKLRLLQDRCNRRMHALGVGSLREYYDCLVNKPMRNVELVSLLNEITIGETSFFRNRPQLDAIQKIVLPRIVEAKSAMRRPQIRVWSAGCSTGEEPYTLAMILLEEMQRTLKGWKVEILATDLNERSLAQAKEGGYGDYSTRNLEPHFRNTYFTFQGNRLSVAPEVRSCVTFNRLNLLDDPRMMLIKQFDLILCCNVLIYFDAASKKKAVGHFHNSLLPHGYLFLGHAESLFGVSDDFHLVHMPSTTAYIKRERHAGDTPR